MKLFNNWNLKHKIVLGIIILFVIAKEFQPGARVNFIEEPGIAIGYYLGNLIMIVVPYFILNWLANRKINKTII